jgi:hypothetical protein
MEEYRPDSEKVSPAEAGSPLALGGLMWGVGVLDAVEVLRYLDATFRSDPTREKGQA